MIHCSGENCLFKHKCHKYLNGIENEERFIPPWIIDNNKFQCPMFSGDGIDMGIRHGGVTLIPTSKENEYLLPSWHK